MNNSYFSRLSVGFWYEPLSLGVNEACFDEKQDIPVTLGKSRKHQSVNDGIDMGKME